MSRERCEWNRKITAIRWTIVGDSTYAPIDVIELSISYALIDYADIEK